MLTRSPSHTHNFINETSSREYLQIKQKLDNLFVSSSYQFPVESVPLVRQLIRKIEDKPVEKFGINVQKLEKQDNRPKPEINNLANSPFQVLAHRISQVQRQNLVLNKQLIQKKQQILKIQHETHKNLKLINTKCTSSPDLLNLFHSSTDLYNQTFKQLQQLQFKYNELMDLIADDDLQTDKKYIKRLIKHKRYQIPKWLLSNDSVGKQNLAINSNEQKERFVSSATYGCFSSTPLSLQKENMGLRLKIQELQAEVELLSQRITLRDVEIERLGKKIQENVSKVDSRKFFQFELKKKDDQIKMLVERVDAIVYGKNMSKDEERGVKDGERGIFKNEKIAMKWKSPNQKNSNKVTEKGKEQLQRVKSLTILPKPFKPNARTQIPKPQQKHIQPNKQIPKPPSKPDSHSINFQQKPNQAKIPAIITTKIPPNNTTKLLKQQQSDQKKRRVIIDLGQAQQQYVPQTKRKSLAGDIQQIEQYKRQLRSLYQVKRQLDAELEEKRVENITIRQQFSRVKQKVQELEEEIVIKDKQIRQYEIQSLVMKNNSSISNTRSPTNKPQIKSPSTKRLPSQYTSPSSNHPSTLTIFSKASHTVNSNYHSFPSSNTAALIQQRSLKAIVNPNDQQSKIKQIKTLTQTQAKQQMQQLQVDNMVLKEQVSRLTTKVQQLKRDKQQLAKKVINFETQLSKKQPRPLQAQQQTKRLSSPTIASIIKKQQPKVLLKNKPQEPSLNKEQAIKAQYQTRWQHQVRQLQEQVQELQQANKMLGQQGTRYQLQVKDLQNALEGKQTELQEQGLRLAQVQFKLSASQNELKQAKILLSRMQQQLQLYETKLHKANSHKQQLEYQLHQTIQQITSLSTQITQLQTQQQHHQTQLQHLKAQLKLKDRELQFFKTNHSLAKVTPTHATTLEDLHEEISKLRQKCNDLIQQNQLLIKGSFQLENQIDEMKKITQSKDDKILELERNVEILSAQLKRIENSIVDGFLHDATTVTKTIATISMEPYSQVHNG